MLRATTSVLLLFAAACLPASADVIYQYTGQPFDHIYGPWDQFFGFNPTNISVTIDVADPFPIADFSAYPVTRYPWLPPGGVLNGAPADGCCGGELISAFISDGLRTFPVDKFYLAGSGTTIIYWDIGGGGRDSANVDSLQDLLETHFQLFGAGYTNGEDHSDDIIQRAPFVLDAFGPQGTWTATITPEVNTGCLSLISGSLLLLRYWRKPRKQ